MTKARDLANIISGGFTADDIPNLDTSKLTTGELANARVADLPASKTTSGTFADARISASSVTQHASTFDDNKIQANIAILGFKTAVNGSLAKYNLQDQIIDEYSDATGVDASASTNEVLSSGAYRGATQVGSTSTHDADTVGIDGDYTWYRWTGVGTGSYSTDTTENVEYLVVAGGGSGGREAYQTGTGGGGGAGGLKAGTGLSLTAGTTYTTTVGAGGTAGSGGGYQGGDGNASSLVGSDITDVTTTGGGGGGGGTSSRNGRNGGSGGGAGGPGTVGTGVSGEGFAGNVGVVGANYGGGGGGAGEAGGTDFSGVPGETGSDTIMGGDGLQNDITGTNLFYAGGGGGAHDGSYGVSDADPTYGQGGDGGGGYGSNYNSLAGQDGTDGLGGGGGGAGNANDTEAGDGGSGVVILRKLTYSSTTDGQSLTLQSTDTTAQSTPTSADMVMLMENKFGTNTLNTDIKGYISRDSGTTFTQGTLVDEGTWGTNKKILAFHDLDISGQPSGTDMCYKITTHNQSASSKEAYVHATSIGWK